MVGVAKGVDRDAGKEEFYRTGKPPFALRHNDPVLYFIQRMRDEAHRFAQHYHHLLRTKAMLGDAEERGGRKEPDRADDDPGSGPAETPA